MKTTFTLFIFLSIFCSCSSDKKAEANSSESTSAISSEKGSVVSKTDGPKLSGKWWYTAILDKDGSDYKLRNRSSNLELHEDGTYNQNIWAGSNLQGREGNYTSTNGSLVLEPHGGNKEEYSVTANGTRVLLHRADGSGWEMEPDK